MTSKKKPSFFQAPENMTAGEQLKRFVYGGVVGGAVGYGVGEAINFYDRGGVRDIGDYLTWMYRAFGTKMSADEIRLFRSYLEVIGDRVSRSG